MALTLQPLLHLLSAQPQLLVDHAKAYADLAADELGRSAALWKRRALLQAAALCAALVAAVLAGVALMLWSLVPASTVQSPWVLLATPLPPLALALICGWAGLGPVRANAWPGLRQQVKADLALWHEASAT